MTIAVHSYTIYHAPNAYLGTVLLRRNLAAVPGAVLVRHPIFVPRERGIRRQPERSENPCATVLGGWSGAAMIQRAKRRAEKRSAFRR